MNIILLALSGRSGSYFLQSLLDGHQEMIFFGLSFNQFKVFLNLDRSAEDIIDEFIKLNSDAFTNEAARPPNFSKHKEEFILRQIDKAKFKDNFLSMCSEKISSHKDFFELVHLAYAKTLGYDIDKIKYMLIHIHALPLASKDMHILEYFMKNYPNFKFLIPIRDFKEMMYSTLAYFDKQVIYSTKFDVYKFGLFSTLIPFNLNSKIIYDIYEQKINDTLFVDLARLHLLQDKAMHKIAEFLGIEYLDCLTQSTIMGEAWLGNTVDCKPISGFDIKKATQKRAINLAYKDMLLFRLFCFNTAKAFGYELDPLSRFEKICAWLYFVFLYICPISAPLWWFEKREVNNMTKEKIKDELYKKLPLWLSKKLILIKKKINRTKKFYKECNSIKIWKKVIEIDKFFKDKIIDKDRFL